MRRLRFVRAAAPLAVRTPRRLEALTTAKFFWYELNTKDRAAALPFFEALLGWTTSVWKPDGAPPGTPEYTMLHVDGTPFGGVWDLPADSPAPSHFFGHIAVPDVDAARARAEALGATFPIPTMDIPTVGRFALMIDPEGAVCSLYTPLRADAAGSEAMAPKHGAVGWNELAWADAPAAAAFYGEVVGWQARDSTMPGMKYWVFGTGEPDSNVAGLMERGPEMPASAWMIYFTTTDIDASCARVGELGGAVYVEPFDVPGVGRMAVAASRDGAVFCLATWDMSN
jgi:predicted enzyme related to lactoylglutathione lyase